MAADLAAEGRAVALIAPRSSPLPDAAPQADLEVVGVHDAEALRSLVKRHDDLVVVVDDAELVLDTACEEVVVELLRRPGGAATVLCAGSSDELLGLFRGLIPEVRKHRTGVLLQPAGLADGDLLGVRVRGGVPGPPGRGLLVDRGRVAPVQVAMPG